VIIYHVTIQNLEETKCAEKILTSSNEIVNTMQDISQRRRGKRSSKHPKAPSIYDNTSELILGKLPDFSKQNECVGTVCTPCHISRFQYEKRSEQAILFLNPVDDGVH
jgi:hypothetical protein